MDQERGCLICLCAGTVRREFPLDGVEEFVRAPQPIKVPRAGDDIAGMMEYRGKLIPLFFLRPEPGPSEDAVPGLPETPEPASPGPSEDAVPGLSENPESAPPGQSEDAAPGLSELSEPASPRTAAACAAVFRNHTGGFYGILADEID